MSRVDFVALVKHSLLVGNSVCVRVFHHEDAVTCRTFALAVTVVDDFANPDATFVIDVDRRDAEHRRLRGFRSEQRCFQSFRNVELT